MENASGIEHNTASARDCCAPATNSRWLNRRNGLTGMALAGGIAALFFGWDWLVAAGVASLIVAIAPCLIMCALGLCMSHKSKAHETTSTAPPGAGAQAAVKEELLRESVPGSQK